MQTESCKLTSEHVTLPVKSVTNMFCVYPRGREEAYGIGRQLSTGVQVLPVMSVTTIFCVNPRDREEKMALADSFVQAYNFCLPRM